MHSSSTILVLDIEISRCSLNQVSQHGVVTMFGRKVKSSKLVISCLVSPSIHFVFATGFKCILKENFEAISIIFVGGISQHGKLSAVLHSQKISVTVSTL